MDGKEDGIGRYTDETGLTIECKWSKGKRIYDSENQIKVPQILDDNKVAPIKEKSSLPKNKIVKKKKSKKVK